MENVIYSLIGNSVELDGGFLLGDKVTITIELQAVLNQA